MKDSDSKVVPRILVFLQACAIPKISCIDIDINIDIFTLLDKQQLEVISW